VEAEGIEGGGPESTDAKGTQGTDLNPIGSVVEALIATQRSESAVVRLALQKALLRAAASLD
jgi:hypothetical protein